MASLAGKIGGDEDVEELLINDLAAIKTRHGEDGMQCKMVKFSELEAAVSRVEVQISVLTDMHAARAKANKRV